MRCKRLIIIRQARPDQTTTAGNYGLHSTDSDLQAGRCLMDANHVDEHGEMDFVHPYPRTVTNHTMLQSAACDLQHQPIFETPERSHNI